MADTYKDFHLKRPSDEYEKRKFRKIVRATKEYGFIKYAIYAFRALALLLILLFPLFPTFKDGYFEIEDYLVLLLGVTVISLLPIAISIEVDKKTIAYWGDIIKQRGREVVRISNSDLIYEYHDYRTKYEENDSVVIKKENIKKIVYNVKKNYVTIYSNIQPVSFFLCLSDNEKRDMLEVLGRLAQVNKTFVGFPRFDTNIKGQKRYDLHATFGLIVSIVYFFMLFALFYARLQYLNNNPLEKLPFYGILPTMAIVCVNGWILSKGLVSRKNKLACIGMIISILTIVQYFTWFYYCS